MEKDYIIAPAHIRHDLMEAEISAVAIRGLLENLIEPAFGCYTCAGLLEEKSKHTGGDKGAAAIEWMEEHFNALYAAIYAANALAGRAMNILQISTIAHPVACAMSPRLRNMGRTSFALFMSTSAPRNACTGSIITSLGCTAWGVLLYSSSSGDGR